MEPKSIELYDFLVQSELAPYYNIIKNELKINTSYQLKYATDEDLRGIGLSRPEIRRLRKFYEKYFSYGYLSKLKRFLNSKREENAQCQHSSTEENKLQSSPIKLSNNKHIIPVDAITVNKQLGVGEFGIVQQGTWTNGNERIQVAIKCLCRERMQNSPLEFLKEAAIMHGIENSNIVRLYGVVLDIDSLMLVTELAPLRSLLECLKDPGLRLNFLTISTLCEFAMQICHGMMYLEKSRLIHRDLAARNVLVFSKNKVKISDFGLSRALGANKDYYQTNFNVNLKLPIAWCAPESINFLKFTHASDVWAYGVCLWEMFSYGFQPWAALTGQQILEAIDEPRCERLEQPDCCPKDYYIFMLKFWNADPLKRPKFVDIYATLPDIKPEILKTIVANADIKKDHLLYNQGDIITVLEKSTNTQSLWKGALNSGKTGLFNPANTVAHIESLPSSMIRENFSRTLERNSKRKLKTEMISRPQNDLKHTGHIGIDGAYFGDVSFLAPQTNSRLPRQVVTPYKPSEDLEQIPLLPPTPTSPDSTQTASAYFCNSDSNQPFLNLDPNFVSSFNFQNTGRHEYSFENYNTFSKNNTNQDIRFELHDNDKNNKKISKLCKEMIHQNEIHEYEKINDVSDDDIPTDKEFLDLGPSLMDEMNSMFRAMTTTNNSVLLTPDFEKTNKHNENTENIFKSHKKNNTNQNINSIGTSGTLKKKKENIVKPISVKDEKILNHAIEITTDACVRSMTDIEPSNFLVHSPKRKFSFRFPNLSHQCDKDVTNSCNLAGKNSLTHIYKERRNFSDNLKNVPDMQNIITNEHRLAYNSLVEKCSKYVENTAFSSRSDNQQIRDEINNDDETCMKAQTILNDIPASNNASEIKFPLDLQTVDKNKEKCRKNLRPSSLKMSISLEHAESDVDFVENDKKFKCDSPSYLIVPNIPFSPDNDMNFLSAASNDVVDKDFNDKINPIPLPPRGTSKLITNTKRHVRKYPLVTSDSDGAAGKDVDALDFFNMDYTSKGAKNNLNIKQIYEESPEDINIPGAEKEIVDKLPKGFIENNFPDEPTYENAHIFQNQFDGSDTLSLYFESVLEDDENKSDTMLIDNFQFFDNKTIASCDEANSMQTEQRVTDEVFPFLLKQEPIVKNKINQNNGNKTQDMTDFEFQAINNVSCEDLLDFSNKKPKGCERGLESDEVRIMYKVLSKKIATERCLATLEFIDWDVHKAIKICRLQNILKDNTLSLLDYKQILDATNWDLQTVVLKLNSKKQ